MKSSRGSSPRNAQKTCSFSFPVSVPSGAYVQMFVVAMVVGVIASLAGVRRISRIDPALAFGGAS